MVSSIIGLSCGFFFIELNSSESSLFFRGLRLKSCLVMPPDPTSLLLRETFLELVGLLLFASFLRSSSSKLYSFFLVVKKLNSDGFFDFFADASLALRPTFFLDGNDPKRLDLSTI